MLRKRQPKSTWQVKFKIPLRQYQKRELWQNFTLGQNNEKLAE